MIWTLSRKYILGVRPSKTPTNQSAHLRRLARILKLICVIILPTVQISKALIGLRKRMLICAFNICMQQSQVFSRRGLINQYMTKVTKLPWFPADSDQPSDPLSLTRVFDVYMKNLSDCHTLPNVTYAFCPVLVSEAPYRYPVSMSVRSVNSRTCDG